MSSSQPEKNRMEELTNSESLKLLLQQEVQRIVSQDIFGIGPTNSFSPPRLSHHYQDIEITGTERCDGCKQPLIDENDNLITPDKLFDEAQMYFNNRATLLRSVSYSNCVQVFGNDYSIQPSSSLNWLRNSLADSSSFLFVVHFQALNLTTEMSLLEFLLSTVDLNWEHTADSDKSLLTAINNDPNVCVVVYGFDEMLSSEINRLPTIPHASFHDKGSAWVFGFNLLYGDLLPNAKNVFFVKSPISENIPTVQFAKHFNPSFTCIIDASTHKKWQNSIGTSLCGGVDKLNKYNTWKGNYVCTNCNAPVCFFLSLSYFMNKSDDFELKSLMPIFDFAWDMMNEKSNVKEFKEEITCFTKFALKNLQACSKLCFSLNDFKEFGVSQNLLNILLQTSVTSGFKIPDISLTILKNKPKMSFSNLIWQEWFGAMSLMCVISYEEFVDAASKLDQERWKNVTRFAFGFSNDSMFEKISAIIQPHTKEVWLKKVKQLRTFIFDKLKEADQYKKAKLILSLCQWVNECESDEIRNEIASVIGSKFLLYDEHLSVPDVAHFFFMLNLVNHPMDFELNLCSYADNALELFVDEVAKLSFRAKCLNISGGAKGAGVSCVGKCLDNIESLYLDECGLDLEGAKKLGENFKSLTRPLREVHIEVCWIRCDGCLAIMSNIDMIENLALIDCGIGDPEHIEAIANEILKRDTPMKSLNLSKNDMQGRGVLPILKCLSKVERLILQECELECEEVNSIAEEIAKLTQPMKVLDLSYNCICNESAVALDRCQHNVDHFVLDYHDLGPEHVAKIAHKMSGDSSRC